MFHTVHHTLVGFTSLVRTFWKCIQTKFNDNNGNNYSMYGLRSIVHNILSILPLSYKRRIRNNTIIRKTLYYIISTLYILVILHYFNYKLYWS